MRKKVISAKRPPLPAETECVPVQAPLGGWDAISSLAAMDPKYGVMVQNWIPQPGWLELRQGYQNWCQGLSNTPVESLMTYRPASASEQLFAATGGYIWNVSVAGQPVRQPIGPFGSNRWQYVNFTPPQGQSYLVAVDGGDGCYLYSNGVWSLPVITGVSPSVFSHVNAHKDRLWFVQKDSTIAWYLPTGGIQGVANPLDFGPLWNKGGRLVATGTWTIDGGLGPNDYFAAVSSRGQLALYSGTDPANASAWSLVGIFDFPPPLGNRPFCRVGSDLWMISLEGVIPVSQGLPFDPGAVRSVAITTRIQNAMLQAAAAYQNNFGWEMLTFPAAGLAILNVPLQANVSQQQYVTNMLTGAWCQFTNWNFNTFSIFNDLLYAGDNNGNVVQALSGPADSVASIPATLETAFNFFGEPAKIKHIKLVQPLMVTSGTIVPSIAIAEDFNPAGPASPAVSSLAPAGARYDVSLYDASYYASGNAPVTAWLGADGIGHAIAIQLSVNVAPTGPGGTSVFDTGVFDTAVFDGFAGQSQTLQLNAFNVVLEKGAVL